MFIGGWRVFTAGFPDASGVYEMPKRIMYRTEPDDWVRLPLGILELSLILSVILLV